MGDLPGGLVVKNLPCNAGDVGSIPGQGTKIPPAAEQLSPCPRITEPMHHNLRVRAQQSKISPDATKVQ